jgi:acetylornithine/N-succinyldiaminopimelate aminotransferase
MTFPYTTPHNDISKALVKMGQDNFMPNYKPREMILDKAEGSRVWDLDGNDYIDFSTGIAVNSLGHRDPDLLKALNEQALKIWHTSNVFFTEPAIRLATAMVENIPFCERVYFCNSGAEANEAGIKLIRKWATENGRDPEHREILTVTGSFHGRTLATVTATAQPKYQEGFEPLPKGFAYCDGFNNIEAIKAAVSDKTCAILIEPIQGEGGIVPMKKGFLKALRKLCDEKNIVLFRDEIQCGMGRTGT